MKYMASGHYYSNVYGQIFFWGGYSIGWGHPEIIKVDREATAPSQRRFALAHIIVCCGASIVAHFARKVRATNT